MKFEVLRQHQGDKPYVQGDIREAEEADVAHLVRSGTLRKAGAKPANKAAPKGSDKSAPDAETKGK